MSIKPRINHQIRSAELRVVTDDGENLGVISLSEALQEAKKRGVDLIEISPTALPPVAKIMDFGKYQYVENKKQKIAKAKASTTETKNIQIKIATGEHDLELKAKKISEWLGEGHRVKIDLFLAGRAKYMQLDFLKERLDRIMKLISVEYKISDSIKKGPKGLTTTIERAKK
ncbi:MAG TPA: translation initiation factor IF-3 [Candidatus Paceibacterota bacterium]|nr:translation initiation factor IF-3 [Candidatus Paceibacterota bacterium]